MTLTHLIPSLRRSIPDPVAHDRWPEFTTVSTTDVTVAGVSLLSLVGWCQTPCIHTAAAVIPGTGGRPSETDLASVVVTRVERLGRAADGRPEAWIDAFLDACQPILSEIRLIGRVSTDHEVVVALRPTSREPVVARTVELPADLRVGDLLAVPCVGVTAIQEVRGWTSHPERLSDDRVDHDREWFPMAHCDR